MKLTAHKLERSGGRSKLTTAWTDQMRRPSSVTLSIKKNDPASQILPLGVMLEGEDRDVTGILNALAEIAWDSGWRPAGLLARFTQALVIHKIPKPE